MLDFFGEARTSGGSGSTLTTTIFSQSFLALVFAALLYPETPPVPFAAANLCLSSLLVAVGVLSDQEHRQRQRADRLLLGTAPLGPSVVVAAHAGHAAFYVCLVTIGMALPPAILLAHLQSDAWQLPGYLLAACACSAFASAGLGVLLRLLDRVFGPLRAALLAGTAKAVLLGGGLVLFALGLRRLEGTADALPIGRLGAELLPPYHAARLLADPSAEVWRLVPLGVAAGVLLLLRVALERGGAVDSGRVGQGGFLRRLLRRHAGRGPRLGMAEFVAVTMWRSPGFRTRVLPLLGLPAGMVFLTLDGGKGSLVFTSLLLQLPAIYLPFVIAFLPRADQSDAGWVFAHAPALDLDQVRDATWRALVTHVLLPVHAIAFGLAVATSAAPLDTAAVALFAASLSVPASRPLLRALHTVPFSQSEEVDGATDLGSLFTAALVLGGIGTLFAAVVPPAGRWALALLMATVAWATFTRQPEPGAVGQVAAVDPGHSRPEPAVRQGDLTAAADASLTRELRAIAVLYLATSLLPTLIGQMFAE